MYNPKEVLTESGYQKHYVNVCNIEYALFEILNNADDLHIGALDDEQLETLYKMQELIDSGLLLTGDGETDD